MSIRRVALQAVLIVVPVIVALALTALLITFLDKDPMKVLETTWTVHSVTKSASPVSLTSGFP